VSTSNLICGCRTSPSVARPPHTHAISEVEKFTQVRGEGCSMLTVFFSRLGRWLPRNRKTPASNLKIQWPVALRRSATQPRADERSNKGHDTSAPGSPGKRKGRKKQSARGSCAVSVPGRRGRRPHERSHEIFLGCSLRLCTWTAAWDPKQSGTADRDGPRRGPTWRAGVGSGRVHGGCWLLRTFLVGDWWGCTTL
jgi:hypothetical protein